MVHTFLRSVGFRDLKKNTDIFDLQEMIVNNYHSQQIGFDQYDNQVVTMSMAFGENFGLKVCGYFVSDDSFRIEHYYPYLIGSSISTKEQVEIEFHASKMSMAGICDELKLGVALIFYVNNEVPALNNLSLHKGKVRTSSVSLSALSASGKVLLPLNRSERQEASRKEQSQARIKLMQMARDGDVEAMEHLTAHDMDIYSTLYRRVQSEDILSIVESSFIPYGIESDQYVVVGDILACYRDKNNLTEENVWVLNLECNHLCFDVIINEKDLIGEPKAGRRFRGRVWMQGKLNF